MEHATSWFLVRFVNHCTTMRTPLYPVLLRKLFRCHLPSWDVVWSGLNLLTQPFPPPQLYGERIFHWAATRELPETFLDDTNQPCLTHQTWFCSGLHTQEPPEQRLISKGKKEISLGLWRDNSPGSSSADQQNANKVPLLPPVHSSAPASLPHC